MRKFFFGYRGFPASYEPTKPRVESRLSTGSRRVDSTRSLFSRIRGFSDFSETRDFSASPKFGIFGTRLSGSFLGGFEAQQGELHDFGTVRLVSYGKIGEGMVSGWDRGFFMGCGFYQSIFEVILDGFVEFMGNLFFLRSRE